jgi:hypothetical protein
VIEKDYEILKYLPKKQTYCDPGDIYSVKRLSDGEVFSVGDKLVHPTGCIDEIESFQEYKNTIHVYYKKWNFDRLKDVRKPFRKPILTTEDGVGLFEGDKAFPIYNDENLTILREGPVNSGIDPVENWLYFSTREAAETYRLNNAKVLSKQDIIDCITETSFPYVKWCKVEELVKSRLK